MGITCYNPPSAIMVRCQGASPVFAHPSSWLKLEPISEVRICLDMGCILGHKKYIGNWNIFEKYLDTGCIYISVVLVELCLFVLETVTACNLQAKFAVEHLCFHCATLAPLPGTDASQK